MKFKYLTTVRLGIVFHREISQKRCKLHTLHGSYSLIVYITKNDATCETIAVILSPEQALD